MGLTTRASWSLGWVAGSRPAQSTASGGVVSDTDRTVLSQVGKFELEAVVPEVAIQYIQVAVAVTINRNTLRLTVEDLHLGHLVQVFGVSAVR
ncbi:MAG: hypothetical protein ABJC10_09215 [Acidobacteriota bacterium]